MNRAMVTGAGGFIGSHLVEECLRDGLDVTAFVHYNSRNSSGWLDRIPLQRDIKIITGDIRDYDSVLSAMQGADTVFHLAALIGIPYSYVSPMAYVKTNVEGTYNVLQAARAHGVGNVVLTSTSETYGTAQYAPINEKHPAVAQSPYAASKIAADQLGLSYARSFGLPVRIVRPFNTYGPRQSSRAIIPTVVTQILRGQRRLNLGNLHPTRDLTYVVDTVRGFLAIARCDALKGEATNIGMGFEISIGELVERIAKIMGVSVDVEATAERIRPAGSEVERLFCDNSRLVTSTTWRPSFTLDSGLRQTIEWIRSNAEWENESPYAI